MLSPSEFSVGAIGDATNGLTLVMPRNQHEHAILVTNASGSPYALFLSGDYQFEGFECSNNTSWNGILIQDVAIEVDERFIFDTQGRYAPFGTLVRHDTQLDVITQSGNGFRRPARTPLILGLPPCRESYSAGFTKWRVVLGEGTSKRELMCVENTEKQVK